MAMGKNYLEKYPTCELFNIKKLSNLKLPGRLKNEYLEKSIENRIKMYKLIKENKKELKYKRNYSTNISNLDIKKNYILEKEKEFIIVEKPKNKVINQNFKIKIPKVEINKELLFSNLNENFLIEDDPSFVMESYLEYMEWHNKFYRSSVSTESSFQSNEEDGGFKFSKLDFCK